MRLSALLFAISSTVCGYSTQPLIKSTGGIDGGSDCSSCHRTFGAANSDPRGSVTVESIAPYVPAVTQNIRVTVRHPDATRWGFLLTARYLNDGTMAGSFAPSTEATRVLCDDGTNAGAPAPCQPQQFSWIGHSAGPRTPTGAGYTFEIQWTPPADENGDIMFYVAGLAANGDGDVGGDRAYTSTLRLPLSPSAGCSLNRKPTVRNAVNAAPHAGPISPNAMVEIYGSDFQSGSRKRQAGVGDLGAGPALNFPTMLSCVAVEIDGQRAPLAFVQQDQINIQAPSTKTTGPVTLVVISNAGRPNELRSEPATIMMQPLAPAFFTFDGRSIAAQLAGRTNLVADPAVVPGAAPAKPGDLLTLYGSGFGATNPPWAAGAVTTGAAPLSNPASVTFGGVSLTSADLLYVGLSSQAISGLYQINLRVPGGVTDGDQPVVVTVGGVASPAGAIIPVKR